jgi:ribosomal protein L44E
MLRVRSITPRIPVGPATAADSWSQMKSHRWMRTSLHRVVDLPITVCMCDVATSLTTGHWAAISAGARWKKFLSQASRRNARSGFGGQSAPRFEGIEVTRRARLHPSDPTAHRGCSECHVEHCATTSYLANRSTQ